MPDEIVVPTTTGATPAPVVAPAPVPAVVAAPAPAPAPVAAPAPVPAPAPAVAPRPTTTLADLLGEKEPDEAAKRLARAGRKALEAVGIKVGKNDDILKVAEEYKAKQEQTKSEVRELKKAATEAERYRGVLSAHMAIEMAKMPSDQQAMLKAIAGEDPAAQMAHLTALRAAGHFKAPEPAAAAPAPVAAPVAAPAPAAAPAPIPAPASSAPAQSGPVPTSANPSDMLTQYRTLKASSNKTEQMQAAMIALQNPQIFTKQ